MLILATKYIMDLMHFIRLLANTLIERDKFAVTMVTICSYFDNLFQKSRVHRPCRVRILGASYKRAQHYNSAPHRVTQLRSDLGALIL